MVALSIDDPAIVTLPTARLTSLLMYWRGRLQGRRCPRKRDIDPIDIPRLLPYLVLFEVAGASPSDYRIRLAGTEVERMNGMRLTGLTLAEIMYRTQTDIDLSEYALTVRHGMPRLSDGRLVYAGRDHIAFDRLFLPLSEDERTVTHLLAIFDYRPASQG